MNIVAGNCAGAFSGFLAQLSWMEIASQPENQISLQLHTRNKTQYWGNSYSNYKWFNSKDCNNFNEIVEENLLSKFFKNNQYITTDISTDCLYTECYPIDTKNIVNMYPPSLKYEGRGGLKDQYKDYINLQIVRDNFYKQWNKFEFTDEFSKLVKEENKLIEGKKVICLMLRQSAHYIGYKIGELDILNYAIKKVKGIIDEYDAILLTTQIQPFIDEFVKVFGTKCIYTQRNRMSQDMDWKGGRSDAHIIMSDEEYEEEYRNVMLDVILTSKTDLIIAGSSNMFLASLCMNPKVSYDTFVNTDGM